MFNWLKNKLKPKQKEENDKISIDDYKEHPYDGISTITYSLPSAASSWNLSNVTFSNLPTASVGAGYIIDCPLCETSSCRIYNDNVELFVVSNIYKIENFKQNAFIEIHYNKKIMHTFNKDIVVSNFRFSTPQLQYIESYFCNDVYISNLTSQHDNAVMQAAMKNIEVIKWQTQQYKDSLKEHGIYFYLG